MRTDQTQAEVQAAMHELVAAGTEVGLQVAAIKDGRVVVDASSGVADPRSGVPVSGDTLFWAASTAKGVASSVAHVLAEPGELDYDLRAAQVWPEFAAHGKDEVTLRHVLVPGPRGVRDEAHFGVPAPLLPRPARQVPADGAAPGLPEPGSPLDRAMPRAILPDAAYANRPDALTADIPSEGSMTARGVARVYAALLGHVDGVALVSPRRLKTMAAVAFSGMDQVMGFPTTWAFGYSPARPGGVASRPGSTFGMVGMNGSAAYADIDSGVAVAVMRNRFATGDLTTVAR